MKIQKTIRVLNNRGSTLLGALLLVTVFGLLAAGMIQLSTSDHAASANDVQTSQAFYVGQAGLEYGKKALDAGLNPEVYDKNMGLGSFSLAADANAGIITSVSGVGQASKMQTITANFSKDCVHFDNTTAASSGTSLTNVKLIKTCNSGAIVDKMTISWNWADCALNSPDAHPTSCAWDSMGALITEVPLDNTSIYKPLMGIGTPGGNGADSGTEMNVDDYTMSADATYAFAGPANSIVFNQTIPLGGIYTINVVFADGSSISDTFKDTAVAPAGAPDSTITGNVSLLAGPADPDTTQGNADGPALSSSFYRPYSTCLSPDGSSLYVVEYFGNRVRKIDLNSMMVSTVAGSGTYASTDGVGINASFINPNACAINSAGTELYVAEKYRIRKINLSTNAVTTLFGSTVDHSYQDGPAATARIGFVTGIATDDANIYIADQTHDLIRKYNMGTATVSTLAGQANIAGMADGTGTAASFGSLNSLSISSDHQTLYAFQGVGSYIRKINISTLAVSTVGNGNSYISLNTRVVEKPGAGNGQYAYGATNNGIVKINLTNGAVTTVVSLPNNGIVDLAVSPAGGKIYFSIPSGNKLKVLD